MSQCPAGCGHEMTEGHVLCGECWGRLTPGEQRAVYGARGRLKAGRPDAQAAHDEAMRQAVENARRGKR